MRACDKKRGGARGEETHDNALGPHAHELVHEGAAHAVGDDQRAGHWQWRRNRRGSEEKSQTYEGRKIINDAPLKTSPTWTSSS